MSLSKRIFEAQAEETPAACLERARQSVLSALSAAADGRPTIETLCDIESALSAAQHELNRLHITLAMIERKIS